ncbi:hypothetical protein AQI95_08865 [Streptomyces yokosukanensis]|uniref:Iron ABC transporter n=1 Tax=Streptomyces yokosukanensis TaxID=67386 RepID=A0A101PBF1_9ACTN|nr:iron chelate uptake ABC transporter family permease subunit [Streptomyces yokosukanensis]KUN08467.1 hypothetical protein AQI95_08865 [Streptomyces yokosukanensis]
MVGQTLVPPDGLWRACPHLPLLCSALTGAVVLVAADLAARTLPPPLEIPVGALTTLVGGPYLLRLLGRGQALGGPQIVAVSITKR